MHRETPPKQSRFLTRQKRGTPAPTSIVSFIRVPLHEVVAAWKDEREGAPKARAMQEQWYTSPPSPTKQAALDIVREIKEAVQKAKRKALDSTEAQKAKRKALDRTEKGKARLARKEAKAKTKKDKLARKAQRRMMRRKARKGIAPPPGQGPAKWW